MANWLTSLFTKDSVVEKAVDGLYNGIDAAWHTSEEKEADNQKRIEMFMKLIELTKNASPARRYIALIVMGVWAFIAVDVVILINLSLVFDIDTSSALTQVIDFAKAYVMQPTSIVLGFYFLTHVLKPFGKSK